MPRLLGGLGLLLALAGIGLDLLPGASPGLGIPQLTLIAAGLLLWLASIGLRHRRARLWLRRTWKTRLPAILLIIALTLLALEALLTASGFATYYPTATPLAVQAFEPWRTCDEAGCRIIREVALDRCPADSANRLCKLNPQGFGDSQAFVVAPDFAERRRILVLGDSFAFGMSAALGDSFVEVLEEQHPQSLIWNTGVPGAGTHHALASFAAYAPLLQPHATVLGFFMNDFENNMRSLSEWHAHEDPSDETVVTWWDLWDNAIQLDQRWAYYYRKQGGDPPASQLERAAGTTRLGSLALRFLDAVARLKREAEGIHSLPAELTRRYLHQLKTAARDQGTALLVLLIPRQSDIGGASQEFQIAAQLLDELGIDALNPIHALDAELDYAADGHWNAAGHHKIALLLSACLDGFDTSGNFSSCAV